MLTPAGEAAARPACAAGNPRDGNGENVRTGGGSVQVPRQPAADRRRQRYRDLADLDRSVRLMEKRLALMHEVARWKWGAGQPVTDPRRERDLLQGVVERGRGRGLDPGLVRSFFAAQ